jgi:hypothetical protein
MARIKAKTHGVALDVGLNVPAPGGQAERRQQFFPRVTLGDSLLKLRVGPPSLSAEV